MKAVTMYRPNTIQNALNDFDRYFESFFGDSILAPASRLLNQLPAVDIRETDKAYVLEMDLPGYDEKNIAVNIDGSNLSIASIQEEEKETKKDKAAAEDEGAYILRERRTHSFSRSFKLPENANPEAVHAAFKNGMLCLEIQKRAESQKRTIQINMK
jgi:HSP20 family protein